MKHTQTIDTPVIDFGAHFYPRLPEAEMPDGKGPREIDKIVGQKRMHDTATAQAEMDESGVDALAYTNNSYLGHSDAEETATSNDAVLEHVEKNDGFYALGAIPLLAGPEEAAAEFERCVDIGLHGGGIHETDVKLTDPEMEPVLEVADQTGAPIYVHILRLPHANYRFNAIFGRERGQQESISRVIHEGLYDRYPNLNIVWHHLGGNLTAMLGRVHLHADPGRWAEQEDMKSFEEFKAQLEERVYVDTAGFFGYTAPIRIALEEMPASQILFGTDYPWEPRSGEELGDLVRAVKESGNNDDVEKILGQNALDLMVNVD